jgi:hypothetical protein
VLCCAAEAVSAIAAARAAVFAVICSIETDSSFEAA